MTGITFAHPTMLYLLLALPALVAWYVYRQRDATASIQASSLMGLSQTAPSARVYARHLPFALVVAALLCIIGVLARPQTANTWANATTEGIDIVIALDVSGSMLARDFQPDRMQAAKDLSIQFISGRRNDRIGLVIFAGESFTLCPLTTDHTSLINLFSGIEFGMLIDGTAIGSGLATAVTRLKESDAPSRVVILLSDGVSNMGEIAPLTAAELARTYGIRVHCIAVGTHGTAPFPVNTPFGTRLQDVPVEIDEALLQQIAQLTGGKYFRATDNESLARIYEELDRMETARIEVTEHTRRHEEFRRFGLAGLALVVAYVLLPITLTRSIP